MTDPEPLSAEEMKAHILKHFTELSGMLVRFIQPRAGAEAEDLVQEVLVLAQRSANGLKDRTRLEAWLKRAVRRRRDRLVEREVKRRERLRADRPSIIQSRVVLPEESADTRAEEIRDRLKRLRGRPDLQERYRTVITAILAVGPDDNEAIARECSRLDPDPGHDQVWARKTKAQLTHWMRRVGLDPRDYDFPRQPPRRPPEVLAPLAWYPQVLDWRDAQDLPAGVASGYPPGWKLPWPEYSRRAFVCIHYTDRGEPVVVTANRNSWDEFDFRAAKRPEPVEDVDIQRRIAAPLIVREDERGYAAPDKWFMSFAGPPIVRLPEGWFQDYPLDGGLRAYAELWMGIWLSWLKPVDLRALLPSIAYRPSDVVSELLSAAMFFFFITEFGIETDPCMVVRNWTEATLVEAGIDVAIYDGSERALLFVSVLLLHEVYWSGTVGNRYELREALIRCRDRARARCVTADFLCMLDAAIEDVVTEDASLAVPFSRRLEQGLFFARWS